MVRVPTVESAEVTDLIGKTPLVSLHKLIDVPGVAVFGKVESLNPGGSVKDRIAVAMLDDAERRGLLRPGGTVVEPSSGNTGTSLAMLCGMRGYRCIITTPKKTSQEKIATMRAYGAEVIVAPNVPHEDMRHYTHVAAHLASTIPGAYMPDQYSNPINTLACEAIGEQIWEQTAGAVTHVVAGLGTGGTACGIANALKRKNPGVIVIGVDPEGSVYSGGEPKPYAVEGIGRHYIPASLDLSVIDAIEVISDADAFASARRAAREAGLLVGGSSGAAIAAAQRLATNMNHPACIVVVLPDSGRSYLSKIFTHE